MIGACAFRPSPFFRPFFVLKKFSNGSATCFPYRKIRTIERFRTSPMPTGRKFRIFRSFPFGWGTRIRKTSRTTSGSSNIGRSGRRSSVSTRGSGVWRRSAARKSEVTRSSPIRLRRFPVRSCAGTTIPRSLRNGSRSIRDCPWYDWLKRLSSGRDKPLGDCPTECPTCRTNFFFLPGLARIPGARSCFSTTSFRALPRRSSARRFYGKTGTAKSTGFSFLRRPPWPIRRMSTKLFVRKRKRGILGNRPIRANPFFRLSFACQNFSRSSARKPTISKTFA